ncbi:MAG: HNH endonuclease [Pseudomonadota bacterium]|nr:HNH endonuclease [Pseudomonadota bacterium]
MAIPHNIRKEDVVSAIREADREPWPSTRNAKTHHLLHEGRLYPVKYIISLASKHAGNMELPSSEFISTESRARLQRLGFKIVSRPAADEVKQQPTDDNKYHINGKTIYIRNTAKPSRMDAFHLLQAGEMLSEARRDIDVNTSRALAYKDAYALAFAASKGEPIPCRGDKAVTNRFIEEGVLRYDRKMNTINPGTGLPKLYASGPERPGNKPGAIYQAVSEGTLSVLSDDEAIAKDIEKIALDKTIDTTTRKALIDARVGQGKFRRDVMARWENACAFSGCMTEAVLRASHIKPWCECSNEERLDPANGLLLAANLDALFDRGLISFEDDGRLLISSRLSDGERELLHLSEGRLRGNIDAFMRRYLAHHRKKFIE